jgi:hypothetical protein
MIKNEFTPLPQAALEKLIEAGNYVFDGKYGSYCIDYLDADEEDDDRGAITLTAQDGSEVITVMPADISYSGAWIRVVDEDEYQHEFTLERRETTYINDIAAELN